MNLAFFRNLKVFYWPLLIVVLVFVRCTSAQQSDPVGASQDDSISSLDPVTNDVQLMEADHAVPVESSIEMEEVPVQDCKQFKTLKLLMEKYRAATEAMANNGDGLDYGRLSGLSSTIKMNIQSYERGGEKSFSPECWEELQMIKSEYESVSITNQVQDLEPQDLDFDNVVDWLYGLGRHDLFLEIIFPKAAWSLSEPKHEKISEKSQKLWRTSGSG